MPCSSCQSLPGPFTGLLGAQRGCCAGLKDTRRVESARNIPQPTKFTDQARECMPSPNLACVTFEEQHDGHRNATTACPKLKPKIWILAVDMANNSGGRAGTQAREGDCFKLLSSRGEHCRMCCVLTSSSDCTAFTSSLKAESLPNVNSRHCGLRPAFATPSTTKSYQLTSLRQFVCRHGGACRPCCGCSNCRQCDRNHTCCRGGAHFPKFALAVCWHPK